MEVDVEGGVGEGGRGRGAGGLTRPVDGFGDGIFFGPPPLMDLIPIDPPTPDYGCPAHQVYNEASYDWSDDETDEECADDDVWSLHQLSSPVDASFFQLSTSDVREYACPYIPKSEPSLVELSPVACKQH